MQCEKCHFSRERYSTDQFVVLRAKREREKDLRKSRMCLAEAVFAFCALFTIWHGAVFFRTDVHLIRQQQCRIQSRWLRNFSNSAGPAALAQFESGPRVFGDIRYIYLRPSPRVSALIKLFIHVRRARTRAGRCAPRGSRDCCAYHKNASSVSLKDKAFWLGKSSFKSLRAPNLLYFL